MTAEPADKDNQKTPAYLSKKTLYNKFGGGEAAYEKYKDTRQKIAWMNQQKREKELNAERQYGERNPIAPAKPFAQARKYGNKAIMGTYNTIKNFGRPAQAQAYYRRTGQLPPQSMAGRLKTVQGYKSNTGRGRPKGTLDQRYAAYGGVYGYRKAMAIKMREERLAINRRLQVSPEQEAYLRQRQQALQAQYQNPERQVIPDTAGQVDMKRIFQDIDDYTNLVG